MSSVHCVGFIVLIIIVKVSSSTVKVFSFMLLQHDRVSLKVKELTKCLAFSFYTLR